MKIGLIGYGNIAEKHEQALSQLPQAQLRAIYDLRSIESAYKSYKNIDDFLNGGLDLITICSPNGLHKQHAMQALEAGHHVICEKPFALSSADCLDMINLADEKQKKIFCTMQNRFSPVSQWLKEIVEQKQLGEIYLVNVACYWNRNKNYYQQADWRGKARMDGGTLYTQFSHYVDTLYWLFGGMEILNANFQNFDHAEMIDFEDTGIFNFTFNQGGMGTFSYTTSCYEKNFESSLTLIGSKGTIKVAGQYMDSIAYCNVEGIKAPELPKNDNLSNIRKVYENAFLDIKGLPHFATSAADGLAVVELIEAIYKYRRLS